MFDKIFLLCRLLIYLQGEGCRVVVRACCTCNRWLEGDMFSFYFCTVFRFSLYPLFLSSPPPSPLLNLLSLFSLPLVWDDTKSHTRVDVPYVKQNIDCGRGGSNEYHNLCFEQKYEKYKNFYLKTLTVGGEIFNIQCIWIGVFSYCHVYPRSLTSLHLPLCK